MLSSIIRWGRSQESIDALLLVGSRASGEKTDGLSDYDISVFGHSFEFFKSDEWLSPFGPFLLCIQDRFSWNDEIIPTRLVIFENGERIDFSFHPLHLLSSMIDQNKLAPAYDAGYRILLDKNGCCEGLPAASGEAYFVKEPAPEEFKTAMDEFYFEAQNTAKYLFRNEPWTAAVRAAAMRSWLLKMLEWQIAAASGFRLRSTVSGKGLTNFLSPEILHHLSLCFGGWDIPQQAAALQSALALFEETAAETARVLSVPDLSLHLLKCNQLVTQLIPVYAG